MHYRKQSELAEAVKVGLFLLGVALLLAVVLGKALDDGFKSRCQVWGETTQGCEK